MKLNAVKIDSFKSLIDEELEFTHNCLSLVGINESGKTNLLKALSCLSSHEALAKSDTPKMQKSDPRVRFELSLTPEELEKALAILAEKQSLHQVDRKKASEIDVTYEVHFDRTTGKEHRSFTVSGLQLPKSASALTDIEGTEFCVVLKEDQFVPVSEAVIVDDKILKDTQAAVDASIQHSELSVQFRQIEMRLAALTRKQAENQKLISEKREEESAPSQSPTKPAPPDDSEDKSIDELAAEVESFATKISKLEVERAQTAKTLVTAEKSARGCQIGAVILKKEVELEKLLEKNEQARAALGDLDTDSDDDEIAATKNELEQTIKKNGVRIGELKKMLKVASQPIASIYSKDPKVFTWRVGNTLEGHLEDWLPRVVFWKYSNEYILSGETTFDVLNNAETLSSIPRPLVNLFRIGAEVQSLNELKLLLDEIATDSSERSRTQVKVNKNVDEFLKGVWEDYDQEIRVTLEHDRIRVEFFDPNTDDASFYKMQERSQGCQTFVSFLMTIGAESRKGVIKNTLLLLDEPETHLHPSGVRFMLKELIKSAENNNRVVFATHSIFMIDKEKYDRHVIVKKKNERTRLQPSTRSRVGFFMQEEVLYSTLDVDVTSEIAPRLQHNFVFEGHGDAVLFETYYNKVLNATGRPFPIGKTSFHHGGKCSDIRKYFSQKPIQLGTHWVFVLDSDEPANNLKNFIQSKYKDFINKYIYVFQYSKSDLPGEIELEDLLPVQMMQEVASEAARKAGEDITGVNFDTGKSFATYFPTIVNGLEDGDVFKPIFKELLNLKIEKTVAQVKDDATFSELFPEFAAWIKTVIPTLLVGKTSRTKVK